MFNAGDKLYRVCANGVLEVVTFVDESLAVPGPDCSKLTFVVRDSEDRVSRCSKERYVGSEREALEKYLKEMEECVPEAERAAAAAGWHLAWVREEVTRVKLVLLGEAVV
jgi:hypothetical protein